MQYLRKVNISDIDMLFQWANDKDVRNYAFNTKKIEYSVHKDWFINRYKSEQCSIFILMDNDDSIGQIRLDYKKEKAYIDYSIQKKYRNRGFGTLILKLVEKELIKRNKNLTLVAQVKKENSSSINRFEKLGYLCSEYPSYFEFHKEIKGMEG